MKKIMFNDKYGLTDAVLQGRKTMTRRMCLDFDTGAIMTQDYKSVLYQPVLNRIQCYTGYGPIHYSKAAAYKVGEVVAVAQSYKSIHEEMMNGDYGNSRYDAFRCAMVAETKGWDNKMFVRADLMPHQIRITDIKVERLQVISEEDCRREGILASFTGYSYEYKGKYGFGYYGFSHIKEAFSSLIDGVNGKGTWESNPYCFCYTFELIK